MTTQATQVTQASHVSPVMQGDDEIARDFLTRLGVSDDLRYDTRDVLRVMRQDDICRTCGIATDAEFAECSYRGYKPVLELGAHNRIHVRVRECERRVAVESRAACEKSAAGIPKALQYCSLRTFETDDVTDSVRRAAEKTEEAMKSGTSLVLAGDVGTGKTHLAASMVVDARLSGRTAMFWSVPALLSALKDFGVDGKYQKTLRAACKCDVLALDDLGVENHTDWGGEQLYIIVNERNANNRQIVVTTNIADPDGLAKHLGKTGYPVVSRLFGMGEWVQVKGDDYRMRKRRKRQA